MYIEDIVEKNFSSDEKLVYRNYKQTVVTVRIIEIFCDIIMFTSLFIQFKSKFLFFLFGFAIIIISELFKLANKQKLDKLIKRKFIANTLAKRFDKLFYDEKGFINSNIYLNSQISIPFQEYYGSDFTLIPQDGYNIEICKLTTSGGKIPENHTSNIQFHGIFGRIVLPNSYPNQIAIVETALPYDNMIYSLYKNNYLVQTLNNDFDDSYNIYAKNTETATHLLNDHFCNQILAFNQKMNHQINLCIYHDVLYFRIDGCPYMDIHFNDKYVDDDSIDNDIQLLHDIIALSNDIVASLKQKDN